MNEELEEHLRITLTPLEREWESSLNVGKLELIKIFPECKEIFKERIKEAKDKAYRIENICTNVMNHISRTVQDFRHKDFLFDSARIYRELYLDDCDKIIKDSNFWLSFFNKKNKSKILNIQKAKQFPISDLIEFNRAGFAKCVKHNEKTASMKYYPKSNTCYCFSCNIKLDAIDIAMEVYKEDFLLTVDRLAGKD